MNTRPQLLRQHFPLPHGIPPRHSNNMYRLHSKRKTPSRLRKETHQPLWKIPIRNTYQIENHSNSLEQIQRFSFHHPLQDVKYRSARIFFVAIVVCRKVALCRPQYHDCRPVLRHEFLRRYDHSVLEEDCQFWILAQEQRLVVEDVRIFSSECSIRSESFRGAVNVGFPMKVSAEFIVRYALGILAEILSKGYGQEFEGLAFGGILVESEG
mmetsp:Transcript_4042/g.7807  ORF Transcript_4042/g.7807 Transcript_4042/m.7807 type:complete len:211 (-) Transcript_4042:2841-3473(-)